MAYFKRLVSHGLTKTLSYGAFGTLLSVLALLPRIGVVPGTISDSVLGGTVVLCLFLWVVGVLTSDWPIQRRLRLFERGFRPPTKLRGNLGGSSREAVECSEVERCLVEGKPTGTQTWMIIFAEGGYCFFRKHPSGEPTVLDTLIRELTKERAAIQASGDQMREHLRNAMRRS